MNGGGVAFYPAVPSSKVSRFSRAELNVLVGRFIPLCLVFIGLFIFSFPSDTLFLIGTGAASLVTIGITYVVICENHELRLMWIMGVGLLLGYAVGTMNTALGLFSKGSSLSSYFSRPQEQFSTAMAVVIWICALLFFLGVFEPPIRIAAQRFRSFDVFYLGLILFVELAAFAVGDIGYMGASTSDAGHVTALGQIASMVGPIAPGLTIFLQERSKLLQRLLVFWTLLGVEVLFLVPQGRRVIIYAVALAVVAFTLRGASWKGPLYKKALIIVVAVGTLYSANIFFYAMRHTRNVSRDKKIGLSDTVTGAFEFLASGKNEEFSADVSANLRDRTFVLEYFSDLLNASWTHEPLFGKVALFGFRMALPSLLYPDKDALLKIGMEENLANPQFGLYPSDQANSILTIGASDFGVVGAFLYPVLLTLLMNGFFRVVTLYSPMALRAIVLLAVIYPILQVEVAGAEFSVLIRNLTMLTIVLLAVDLVTAPRRQQRPRPVAISF